MPELRRLYAGELPQAGGELRLSPDAVRHAHVLRMSQGDRVCLFDARGLQAEAVITHMDRGSLVCRSDAPCALPEPAHKLTLVLGVPKAQKLDPVVRMVTELGAHAVRLAQTERSIPKLDSESPKLERARRIAHEACAQSGQPRAPIIAAPEPLIALAAQAPAGALRLVFWENASEALSHVLAACSEPLCDVWAVVGPEGGLDAAEVEQLVTLGYRTVGLGENILRVDTAVVVAAALLLERMRG
jgi:16S rRNA (uracil1498-N3)-methyltransferase